MANLRGDGVIEGLRSVEINGMSFSYKLVNSPVGVLKLVASETALVALVWENDNPRRVRLGDIVEAPLHPLLVRTEHELKEYFARERRTFSVPLDMRGTRFQTEVRHTLLCIPFGETRSYGDIAKRLGNPGASRAVGAANGRNPISIIIPCHRVIGATGKLTGFAGGFDAKIYLLKLEAMKWQAVRSHSSVQQIKTNSTRIPCGYRD
jgi:methylated-DNA-[protein]-cysteine S-methyltransferase